MHVLEQPDEGTELGMCTAVEHWQHWQMPRGLDRYLIIHQTRLLLGWRETEQMTLLLRTENLLRL